MDPDTTILEEDIDENYEPTQEGTSYAEIEEYALYLGLDLDEDQDLLYIAREGLKAPLPAPWKPCQTKNKDIFYFNFDSQESVWEHPCDRHYKEKVGELKAAKSKRRGMGEQRPARTPPSAGKSQPSAPPKAFDLASKGPKGDKATVEMEAFRQELEAEKAMVVERNEGQLEEYKKDLKAQLTEEEQRLRLSLESEKEQRMAEKRKSLSGLQDQEKDRVRTGKQQRLDALKASKGLELEQARRRLEEENSRATALFLESETRRAQGEMRNQSQDVDQRLSQLRSDLSSAQATLSQVSTSKQGSEPDTSGEMARIQASKDTVLRAEVAKEKNRYESELLSIQSSLQARLSSLAKGPLPASYEDTAALEVLRQDCERDYQTSLQTAKAKFQDKLLVYRQELESRYESERQAAQTREGRSQHSRIEDEKRRIAEEANRTLQDYSRGLDRDVEEERRRLEEDWSRKLDSMRTDGSRGQEVVGLERELTALQEKLRQREREVERLRKDWEEEQGRKGGRSRPATAGETQGRVERMERDIGELKRLVVDASAPLPNHPTPSKPNDPIHEWRTSLLQMKQEIKEFQHVLDQEKRIWMADCANYRDHPSAERKAELQAVKRVLDHQIGRLNEKVKELKLVESWIRRQEGDAFLPSPQEELEELRPAAEALEPEDDVLVRWRYGAQDQIRKYSPALPIQPYVDQKFSVYQRFLSREAVQREQIQSIFMRQNAWISNMKEELAKVHFAPRPRTSYYY